MLHRHDGQPARIELQGRRAVILWAWAGEWIAQLVLADYGALCLTVFADRPAEGECFTGTVAVAEAMAAAGLVLSVELAALGSVAVSELATELGRRM